MPRPASSARQRTLLGLASVAVAFAAADTYVVVLALPDMMRSVDLSIDQLQRAAPIISGFLLGYVAMLPLIGRLGDLRGRVPVLVAALVLFGLGSLVTAAAYDLPSLTVGRFLQGVGGGGLVPVTLALVADLYPVQRRAVPLGVVGAVQELGSVLGPLYGAGVLLLGTWRDIFWINLAVALALAAVLGWLAHRSDGPRAPALGARRGVDPLGSLLVVVGLAALLLVMRQPSSLVTSVTWGAPFVPFAGAASRWWSPLGVATIAVGLLLLARCLAGGTGRSRPVVDLRGWWLTARQADLLGALLLATALAGVILAFATADPQVQVLSPAGPWLLAAAAAAALTFWWHSRHAVDPLVPRGSLRPRSAWGALLVSFFTGAALIAALVDIPVFARLTVYGDSQVKAALVLVEFLVALPIGALAGGLLARRLALAPVAAAGMAAAATGFALMAGWNSESLTHRGTSGAVLALTGLGFGLAIAPVNAALLAATRSAVHGVSSALLVVARMVGMLVGISALTTIGLRRYYAVESGLARPHQVCGGDSTRCPAYTHLLESAGLAQLHAIFIGALACAAVAGVLSLILLRRTAQSQ